MPAFSVTDVQRQVLTVVNRYFFTEFRDEVLREGDATDDEQEYPHLYNFLKHGTFLPCERQRGQEELWVAEVTNALREYTDCIYYYPECRVDDLFKIISPVFVQK